MKKRMRKERGGGKVFSSSSSLVPFSCEERLERERERERYKKSRERERG